MSEKPCCHPPESIQSGCHAGPGTWLNPICMACGEEIISAAEVLITQELDISEPNLAMQMIMGRTVMSELQKYYATDLRKIPKGCEPRSFEILNMKSEVDAARAADKATIADLQERMNRATCREFKLMSQLAEMQERLARSEAEHCERICAAIKSADDQSSDDGYMYDSDDCIAVVREYFAALAAADDKQGEQT